MEKLKYIIRNKLTGDYLDNIMYGQIVWTNDKETAYVYCLEHADIVIEEIERNYGAPCEKVIVKKL